jgi:IMP dehydrogenase
MLYTYDDIILVPQYNPIESRKDVLTRNVDSTGKLELELPVISANMDTITGFEMAKAMREFGGIGALHRFCTIDENISMFKNSPSKTFVSVGCSEKELARVEALRDAGADYFCIDIAHGHSFVMGNMLRKMREMLPNSCIMAGNVATLEGYTYLEKNGADIVKVGIGPGSVCTTRITTGFGYPQASALEKITSEAKLSIVADGGIKTPGDIVKALVLGADFVMVGSILAGTGPTPSQEDSEGYKTYRGMASQEAYESHFGKMPSYKTHEGVERKVKSKNFENIMNNIVGGLRSGMTYAGASRISELRRVSYEIISSSSYKEGTPHFSAY